MVFPRDKVIEDYDRGFFLHKGERLGSLSELMEALEYMEEYQFRFHVNDERNDFANWIRDVFEEAFLAKRVERAGNIRTLKKVLFCYIYK